MTSLLVLFAHLLLPLRERNGLNWLTASFDFLLFWCWVKFSFSYISLKEAAFNVFFAFGTVWDRQEIYFAFSFQSRRMKPLRMPLYHARVSILSELISIQLTCLERTEGFYKWEWWNPPISRRFFEGCWGVPYVPLITQLSAMYWTANYSLEILCYRVLTRQKYSVKIACGSAGNFSGLAVNKLRDCWFYWLRNNLQPKKMQFLS